MAVSAEEIEFNAALEIEARVHRQYLLLNRGIAGNPVELGITGCIHLVRIGVSGRVDQTRIGFSHIAVAVVAEVARDIEEAAAARLEAGGPAHVFGAPAPVVPILTESAGE